MVDQQAGPGQGGIETHLLAVLYEVVLGGGGSGEDLVDDLIVEDLRRRGADDARRGNGWGYPPKLHLAPGIHVGGHVARVAVRAASGHHRPTAQSAGPGCIVVEVGHAQGMSVLVAVDTDGLNVAVKLVFGLDDVGVDDLAAGGGHRPGSIAVDLSGGEVPGVGPDIRRGTAGSLIGALMDDGDNVDIAIVVRIVAPEVVAGRVRGVDGLNDQRRGVLVVAGRVVRAVVVVVLRGRVPSSDAARRTVHGELPVGALGIVRAHAG